MKTDAGSQDCQVLSPTTTTLHAPAGSFFFANAGGKGYYRSAYKPSNYAALVAGVETKLTPPERIKPLSGDGSGRFRTARPR